VWYYVFVVPTKEKAMDTDATTSYMKKHNNITDMQIPNLEASKKVRRYLPAG
jgi:hypothetical protein